MARPQSLFRVLQRRRRVDSECARLHTFAHPLSGIRTSTQKAASPMVIAQCYQMGPATKIDPLMMIADAKRVCDNLVRQFSLSRCSRSHTAVAREP